MSEEDIFVAEFQCYEHKGWVISRSARDGESHIRRLAWRREKDRDNNIFAVQYWGQKEWYALLKENKAFNAKTLHKAGPFYDTKSLELAMNMLRVLEND